MIVRLMRLMKVMDRHPGMGQRRFLRGFSRGQRGTSTSTYLSKNPEVRKMNVAASSAVAASSSQGTQPVIKKELTQEDFLSLLLAQMQHHDPLNPMDNYQMAAQMAQLSTVEGINKLTQSMDVMSAYQA